MNIQAVHLALIKQAAKLARRRESGWQHWAEKCLELIAQYRRVYDNKPRETPIR